MEQRGEPQWRRPHLALPRHAAIAPDRIDAWPDVVVDQMGLLRDSEQGPKGSSPYHAAVSLFSSWSRSSSRQSTPLLPGQHAFAGRGLTIRTPRGDASRRHRGAADGLIDLLRVGGRSRRTVAYLAAAVVLFFYFVTGARIWRTDNSMRAFVKAGGFGLDYMGRAEDETAAARAQLGALAGKVDTGPERLPPVPVEGGLSKLCALFPWRKDCAAELKQARDPFQGLVFKEEHGHLFYPAVAAPEPPPTFEQQARRAAPVDVDAQPHPIHYLIREGKKAWKAKVARQSKTLREAVAEYEKRYWRRPPKGFDQWFEFAKKHDFVMIDEFDAMMDKVLPFLAVKPSTLAKRHQMIQFDQDFWIQVRGSSLPRCRSHKADVRGFCRTRPLRSS